ncbi:hypothetical protein [Nonomuraea aridisoli]|uniref:Type II toxin-antitoxin system RelE/ParE family toxin n=1 Tax=Nonomuraea aridisoli TaxID=2070368 RepID=A0A2W2F8S8_9ACTN|nr:hypothetical protein [Nonomuraea aridisoli]PZG18027.1 hypothetical protein C1J01_16285 [Nonomuraea aridisoli]
MKVPVHFAPGVKDALRLAPLTLRASIVDALLDLADDPTPPDAVPYAEIPGAYELVTPTFRALYTYGPDDIDHVSIWVLHINT